MCTVYLPESKAFCVRKTKHATCYTSGVKVPFVVTDITPFAFTEQLYSAFVPMFSIPKTDFDLLSGIGNARKQYHNGQYK